MKTQQNLNKIKGPCNSTTPNWIVISTICIRYYHMALNQSILNQYQHSDMLFSFKNKVHYLNTYIALYFRTPKLPVKHTHNPKKIVSIPLTLVPSLANYPLLHTPPSLGVSPSHTQTCHSRQHIKSGAGGQEYVGFQVSIKIFILKWK